VDTKSLEQSRRRRYRRRYRRRRQISLLERMSKLRFWQSHYIRQHFLLALHLECIAQMKAFHSRME
jgi:hypothetical protein